MKKFTPEEIKRRIVTKLTSSEQWKSVLQGGAVDSVITSLGEPTAELSRYFEYLLRESRWDTARNLSSILSQTPAMGYKPSRKTSSIGYIMVSHDPNFANAGLPNSGMIDFEDIVNNLTPYTGSPFTIVRGTQLKTSTGRSSVIVSESTDYKTGDKYAMVPVVEGEIKTESKTMLGNSFEVLIIDNENVEANGPLSGKFFRVTDASNNIYTEVESIFLAEQDQYAYELSTNKSITQTRVKFGNGISGRRPPVGAVTVRYLQTKGKEGVIPATFLTWVPASPIATPSGVSLVFRNIQGILGGKNQDTIEDIRKKAPNQYLLEGGVTTYDGYKAVIESIPTVLRAKVFYGVYTDPRTNITKDTIFYTAIDEKGASYAPDTIEPLVERAIVGKNNPLDFYKYTVPKLLHIRMNVRAKTDSTSPELIKTSIYDLLYEQYKTVNQEFMQTLDPSKVIEDIRQADASLREVSLGVECIADIKGSEFIQWTSNQNFYLANFSFDPSYQKLKLYENGVLHCLRIDVIMACSSCEASQRTLLIVQSPSNPSTYSIKQFFYIGDALDLTETDTVERLLNNQIIEFQELTDPAHSERAQRKINFNVVVDLNSFSSVGGSSLAQGTIYIPSTTNSELYFDFEASDLEKDAELTVQVIAQPVNSAIRPSFEENILRVDGETNLRDIRVGGINAVS